MHTKKLVLRRISTGYSAEELVYHRTGNSDSIGADGAVGGGILDLFASGYFQREGTLSPDIIREGISATGGNINEYSTPPGALIDHIFLQHQVL